MANLNYEGGFSPAPVRCPGKEIAGLILGINSVLWSVIGLFFCWHFALALVYAGFGIGMGIAALILHKKVMEQATVTTGKIKAAKILGIIGIIVSVILLLLGILILVLILLGTGLFSGVYGFIPFI